MTALSSLFADFSRTAIDVALAIGPLAALLIGFQALFLRVPWSTIVRTVRGLGFAYVGLALFLQGVNAGFMPAAKHLGRALALSRWPWLLVPIGFVLGLVATLAEPAVRILNHEVEKASGGHIPARILMGTISLGVAMSVAMAMLRALLGFPVWYLLLPGYALALGLAWSARPEFTAIAFDSGGVATGPMTVTVILAVSVGVAEVLPGRNPLSEGFGLVALVALAPIVVVLVLGRLYAAAQNRSGRDNGGKSR